MDLAQGTVHPQISNPRKRQLMQEIDASLDEQESWRKFNAAYHEDDVKFMRFLIPAGKRVLELGCGTGDLLAALQPSYGVGIDFGPQSLARARTRHPHLNFVLGDVEDPDTLKSIEGPFDYIVIADTIGMFEDIDGTLRLIHQLCEPATRIVISYYSHLWEPVLMTAEAIGLRRKQPKINYIANADFLNLMDLADFEVISAEQRQLLPQRWLGLGPLPTFAATAVALIAGGLLVGPRMVIPPAPAPAPPPRDAPRRSMGQISAVIWVLGLLALCGQVGEGAAGDWSAVYLHVDLGTSAAVAAAGLAAFSVTMAAGRVAGDRLAARFGSVRLVRASGLVAGLGLAAGLLIGTPAAAVAGFALLGAGLAAIFPQIVSSAVRLDPARAGRNIGRIAAVAYSGLLGGPVAIGAAASGVGLRDALLIPAALSILVAAAAGVLSPHQASRGRAR